jgi:RNA polymerase-binding transcription factor DksA
MNGPLTSNERDECSALIAKTRRRTLARVHALEHDRQSIVDASEAANLDDEHDPEGATVAYERAFVISLLESARSSLAALDDAEARIQSGGYGTCARCGRPIGIERLRADPAVAVCVRCAA